MLTTWETLKYNKNNFLLPPSTSFIATLSEKVSILILKFSLHVYDLRLGIRLTELRNKCVLENYNKKRHYYLLICAIYRF